MIDWCDPRMLKAVRAVRDSHRWFKVRSRQTGKVVAVAIPSASRANLWHMVTFTSCDCPAFAHQGDCFHRLALHIRNEQGKREQAAAQAA
jgi:uncharacterized Zn finger protein